MDDTTSLRELREFALVEAVEALRRIEWVWDGEEDRCPACGLTPARGHDRSCTTGVALARFPTEVSS